MSKCSNAVDDQFVEPNTENIKNLGPGCFVRIQHQSKDVWVEITGEDAGKLKGTMHPELSNDQGSNESPNSTKSVQLEAKQITALGCDRFCYCD